MEGATNEGGGAAGGGVALSLDPPPQPDSTQDDTSITLDQLKQRIIRSPACPVTPAYTIATRQARSMLCLPWDQFIIDDANWRQ
jgi:hypothetical protein